MTDIDALNRDFTQVRPGREGAHLSARRARSDEFDEDYEIATLDFEPFLDGDAADKARFAEAFAAALEEIGFAVLVGHGVDPALYDEIDDAMLDLFDVDAARREDALPG